MTSSFLAGFTSDQPCIENSLHTLNSWLVWSENRGLSLKMMASFMNSPLWQAYVHSVIIFTWRVKIPVFILSLLCHYSWLVMSAVSILTPHWFYQRHCEAAVSILSPPQVVLGILLLQCTIYHCLRWRLVRILVYCLGFRLWDWLTCLEFLFGTSWLVWGFVCGTSWLGANKSWLTPWSTDGIFSLINK